MRISHAVAAATLALALPLTACAEKALEEPELTNNETTSAQAEATTETETVTEQAAETYEDVDPSLFDEGGAYVVGGASGVLGCMAKPSTDYPFNCQIKFADPVPPAEDPDGVKLGFPPNIASYDDATGRFRPEFSPGSQGYMDPPTPLEKGKRVTIDGATMTHLHDGGFRVEYKGDSFEVHDGVYSGTPAANAAQAEDKPSSQANQAAPAPAAATSAKGEQCGTWDLGGQTMGVYAVEDGTTCDQAMDSVREYFAAAERGEFQGTATAWTNPANGWGCTSRYILPGDADEPSNRKIACTDSQMDGTKAFAGSGAVALLDPASAARL